MRMYLSSMTYEALLRLHELRPDVKVHILRSYLNDGPGTFKVLLNMPPNVLSVACDSNTYHITTNDNEHNQDIETHAHFVKNNSSFYPIMFNFDIEHGDDGTEACWENQYELERRGLNIVPVIQNLEYEVPHVIERGDELVAIGSTRMKKMDEINDATDELYRNNICTHLFGVGSMAKLLGTKAWSSDCSSFGKWIASGRAIWFDEVSQKEISFAFRKYNKKGKMNPDYIREHILGKKYQEWLWEHLGVEIEDLFNDHNLKLAVNAYYFWELEQRVTQSQKDAGIHFKHW
ncbi:hypothetical protein [Maridesulfovibrio bastinii]|uniref:hypothetical protein n=1 Tax=Maridesulfovibrio bastinii TaxID=47157 RepID=UPI000413966F|nr:hypothetical protein [Maridesulfovibrio bastinii]